MTKTVITGYTLHLGPNYDSRFRVHLHGGGEVKVHTDEEFAPLQRACKSGEDVYLITASELPDAESVYAAMMETERVREQLERTRKELASLKRKLRKISK